MADRESYAHATTCGGYSAEDKKEEGLPSRGRVTAPTSSLVVLPALGGVGGTGEPVAPINSLEAWAFRLAPVSVDFVTHDLDVRGY
jgi:hypothetical protein